MANVILKNYRFFPFIKGDRTIRFLLTNCENDNSNGPQNTSSEIKRQRFTRAVESNKINQLTKLYPGVFKPQVVDHSNIYCIEKKLAVFIKDCVCSMKTSDDTVPIFEANPGMGLITDALLRSGINNLCAFEPKLVFLPFIEQLQTQHPGKLTIVKQDLVSLSSLHRRQLEAQDDAVDEILKNLTFRQWEDSPSVTIIAAISPLKMTFLRFFLYKIATMQSIFSYGRAELFAFISEKEYKIMFATEKDPYTEYRSASILYQLFCDIQLIEKVPTDHFLPNPTKKQNRKNGERYYFVHIIPKSNLFEAVASKEYLPDLLFFVTQSLTSRSNMIIPTIEKWIPGCGPKLIKCGIGLFTQFGELTPDKILQLFHTIATLPEYEESILKIAITNAVQSEDL